MRHKVGFNRLGRSAAHRRAMTRNMVTSLFKYERIRTTKAKALAVRRIAEKMITRARLDSVHNRRMIARDIGDKAILAKLFTDIGPRYQERPGGYTRVLKLGPRSSDAAEMVILELVEQEFTSKSSKKSAPAPKKATKSKSPKSAEKAQEEAVEASAPEPESPAPEAETEVDSEAAESSDAAAETEASEEEKA